MFNRYIRIIAMLLCLCLLSACAAPAEKPAEATEESCTVEEAPVETLAPTPEPTPEPTFEPWLDYAVNSPQLAEQIAREEIEKMKEMGLLSKAVTIEDGPAEFVRFFNEPEALYRTDRPYFAVRWYLDSWYGNNWEGEDRYSVIVDVDAQSGKLMLVTIEAAATEDAEVVFDTSAQMYNEENPQANEVWLYHENFYDIFEESMSIAGFCDLLNEYWEFDGWSLAGGGALNTNDLLLTVSGGHSASRYVVFTFDGDEAGKHMYVSIAEFPGRVCLCFGPSYPKG